MIYINFDDAWFCKITQFENVGHQESSNKTYSFSLFLSSLSLKHNVVQKCTVVKTVSI